MASKKGGGQTRQKKDSAGRRLGLKKNGEQLVKAGNIICRQRGTQWHPGENVDMGKDHTIFATSDGIVKFNTKGRKERTYISVIEIPQKETVKKTDNKEVTVKKKVK